MRFAAEFEKPDDASIIETDAEIGVNVVSSPLSFLGYQGKGSLGQVTLSVAPFARIVITPNQFPWRVAQIGESAHDDLIPAYEKSRQEGLNVARKRAKTASQRTGWFESEKREPILSVRMSHKCDHDPINFIQRACGHHFCAVCNGHVDPFTKNVAQGEYPVVGCNRQLQHRERYSILFQEFSPQARYSFAG